MENSAGKNYIDLFCYDLVQSKVIQQCQPTNLRVRSESNSTSEIRRASVSTEVNTYT